MIKIWSTAWYVYKNTENKVVKKIIKGVMNLL